MGCDKFLSTIPSLFLFDEPVALVIFIKGGAICPNFSDFIAILVKFPAEALAESVGLLDQIAESVILPVERIGKLSIAAIVLLGKNLPLRRVFINPFVYKQPYIAH